MKTVKKFSIILTLVITAIFSSCSTSNPTPTPAVTTNPDGFTWTQNGETTARTGFTPFFVNQGHSLFVQNSAGTVLFEFNFNSLAPATNNLAAMGVTGNGAQFFIDYQFAGVTSTNRFLPSAGTCIITSNANGKISGTFTASGSTGSISSVQGTFKNITVQ